MATLSYNDEIQLRRLLNDFGVPPGEAQLVYQQDSFTGDGVTFTFTLNYTPTIYPVFVYLNGVLQQSPEQITVTGTSVAFVTIPVALATILCAYCHVS